MYIRSKGAKAVIAVSPQTTIESIENLLDYTDGVLVMLVIPGFSGQLMIRGMEKKVEKLKAYRERKGLSFFIEVDGHVSENNVVCLEEAGAEVFVAGTSLFGQDCKRYGEVIKQFYSI